MGCLYPEVKTIFKNMPGGEYSDFNPAVPGSKESSLAHTSVLQFKAKIQSLCQWNHFCSPHHKEVCWDAPEPRRKSKVLFQVLGLLTVGWNWINHSSTRTDYFFLSPLSGQYEPENSCHGLLSMTVKAENLRTRLYSSVFLKTNFKMKRERFTFNNLLLYHTLGRSRT